MSAIAIPFRFEGGRVVSTDDPVRITNQKVLDVLVTRKLERVGISDYGVGMYNYVFENITELIEADLKIDLVREVQSRVSGVGIIDVGIRQEDPGEYVVTVYYRTPISGIESVVFSIRRPDLLTEESSLP